MFGQKKLSPPPPATAFARPLSRLQLANMAETPGKPAFNDIKKPWQGLAPMFSETKGPMRKK